MSKRKETESTTPPQLLRVSRRKLYTSPDMNNMSQLGTSSPLPPRMRPPIIASPRPGLSHIPHTQLQNPLDPLMQTATHIMLDPAAQHPEFQSDIQLSLSEGGSVSFTQTLLTTMSSPSFLGSFAPVLAQALAPYVASSVQTAVQALTARVTKLEGDLVHKNKTINELVVANENLQTRLLEAEVAHEELEQYGRRNSLRFHNVKIPEGAKNTDEVIVKLCEEKLNVKIDKDDINRSHPIGKPNKEKKSQIICRFKNWKVKNSIFSEKSNLKGNEDNVFITEDLTKYRQDLIKDILVAKRAGKVAAFWTSDGRIFLKETEDGPKTIIKCFEDLDKFFQDQPVAASM